MNVNIPSLLIATLVVAANAQEPLRPRATNAAIANASGVTTIDGDVVAAGAAYKATFRDGAFEYVPALGTRVETNLPWSFRLTSIRRGITQLLDGTVPVAGPTVDGDRVSWLRGDVVERYDVRAEGIEQSFVFPTRPEGAGDLVVTGHVVTDLVPAPDGARWRFVREGVGGVRLGEVVGVDATGRRVAGSTRVIQDRIEFTLPAGFVDAATYPLVLDPLIGTEFLVASGDSKVPDCAYDHTTNRWLVVWQQHFSLSDVDIRGIRLDADTGAAVGPLVIVDAGPQPCTRPRVADIAGVDRFLVVYQRGASLFGPFDVRGCAVDAAGALATMSSTLRPDIAQEPKPCVGGEASDQGNSGVVVCEDTALWALKVVVPAVGPPFTFSSGMVTPSNFAREPAISRSGGLTGRYLVTWTEVMFSSDTDVQGRAISRDLALLTPLTTLLGGATIDGQTAVDGDGAGFVVAHSRREPVGTLRDVRAMRVEYAAGALSTGPDNPIEATPNEDEFGPDIAWLGPKYCVTFVERQGPLDDDVGAWLIDASCTTCNARITLDGVDATPASNHEWAPRVGGRWAFAQNNFNDDGLIVATESLDAPLFTGVITAQRVQALAPGLPPVVLGGGCGSGGVPAVSAPFVVGNADFHFLVSGLEPGALPLINLGFPGPPVPCGVCSILPPVILEAKPNVGGTASSLFAVPCDPTFAGFQLEFQWLSLFTTVNPCSLIDGLSMSDRVALTADI